MAVGGTANPIRCKRFARLCAEKIVWRRSPVPARPTTSPYPISWLSRAPSSVTSSFKREGAPSALPRVASTSHANARSRFIDSKREKPHQDAEENKGTADRVSDYAFALDCDLHLGDPVGRDGVVRRQVGGTHDA